MRSLTAALAAALVLVPATPAWAANTAPVVVDDAVSYRNTGGIDYVVNALANDSDADGDPLTYTAVTPATKGNAYLQGGQLFYKPYLANTGTDSFSYTVTDGQGNMATGTVTATLWVDPPAPTGLSITGSGVGSATVTWTAPARAASYRVYRDGLLVAGTSGLTFTDNSLVATGGYRYEVAALNGGGFEGPRSTRVYRQSQLTAPTGLAVDVTDDPTTLSLTWSAGGNLGPWNVYRDGALLTSRMTPAFEDTGLVTGRGYSYQVQHAFPPTSTSVFLPSALSAPVTGTPGEPVTTIGRLFQDLGGTGGVLGPVTAPESAIPGGRQQSHQNGLIVQQDGEAPVAVMRPLSTAYISAGGATGGLGFPLAEQETGLRASGVAQLFEHGSIWYSPLVAPSAIVVADVIEDGWAASGWEDGSLGYPAIRSQAKVGGVAQIFEGGGVWWSAATGSHGVRRISGFWDVWGLGGYEAGRLGYPTTDEECGLPGGGCVQEFEGGSIYSSTDNGVHAVFTPYRDAWARHGAEAGRLGYPTTDEICGRAGGGCYQQFQGGTIHWSGASGMRAVFTPYRDTWARHGAEAGRLGYPTTDEICGGGGCYQRFQGGSINWSPAGGMRVAF